MSRRPQYQFSLASIMLLTMGTAVLLVFGRVLLSILVGISVLLVIFVAFLLPALILLRILAGDAYDISSVRSSDRSAYRSEAAERGVYHENAREGILSNASVRRE